MNSRLVKIQEIQSRKKEHPEQWSFMESVLRLLLFKVFIHDLGNRRVLRDKAASDIGTGKTEQQINFKTQLLGNAKMNEMQLQ